MTIRLRTPGAEPAALPHGSATRERCQLRCTAGPATYAGPVTYPARSGSYPTDYGPRNRIQNEEHLRRIAEALERIADAVAGPVARTEADPLPSYPVIAEDGTDPTWAGRSEPHIACWDGSLYLAVCTRCPAKPGQVVDPSDSSTCLEYADSSYDLDEQRAALTRHLGHHLKLEDPTAALPIWTWSDQPCSRCHAPIGQKCRTAAGRPSTAVHAARWQDHSPQYW
ncbi:zinc finger domain-containing protein [Actinoplanes flavus]|uniref:zinc finger domain-containing protein n=1 Tax=Actinoplanes flavus TaxID=2820290 RepID=UPI003FD6F5B7